MKNSILLSILILIGFTAFSQNNTTLITEREENGILMGTVGLDSYTDLFVGQEYSIEVMASSDHDIKILCTNASIVFDEGSSIGTGPMRYKLTPLDTGKCYITLGVQLAEKRSIQLLRKSFNVINYTIPPIHISKTISGGVIRNLDDSTSIICNYPTSSGVYDTFEIMSWKAKLGDLWFSGTEGYLSSDLISAINESEANTTLYVEVELIENKTGHTSTKGVFIIE